MDKLRNQFQQARNAQIRALKLECQREGGKRGGRPAYRGATGFQPGHLQNE